MTKANFKNSVIALAIGLFAVSCGSGGNKQKQSGNTSETKTEQAAKINLADHYTAVQRHKVDFIEDWMLPTDGILTLSKDNGWDTHRFTISGMNQAQLEKYVKTLEAKGLKEGISVQGDVYKNDNVTIIIDKMQFKEEGSAMKKISGTNTEILSDSNLDIYISK